MARRIVRHDQRARAAVRALEDACTPLEEALFTAKERYWDAVEGGDQAVVLAAKTAKQTAASRLEETRTWLRREAEILKLQTRTIPKLESILAGPMLVKDGKDDAKEDPAARAQVERALAAAVAELEKSLAVALPLRQALQELGGQVVGDPVPTSLPTGSADVTLPAITVRPRARRASTDGGR